MVRLDLQGDLLTLRPEQAERLRRAALARAGFSSRSRDLALVLDWALNQPGVVTLHRGEAAELRRLLTEDRTLTDLATGLRPDRSGGRQPAGGSEPLSSKA